MCQIMKKINENSTTKKKGLRRMMFFHFIKEDNMQEGKGTRKGEEMNLMMDPNLK